MSEIPTIGGRYTVERLLGEGGMGAVYLGQDTHTQTPVAIKSLKSDLIKDNPEILQRFEREAEALRKLNHPNIVKVLTTAAEQEQHYIIMEYVSGGSLADLLQIERQLPIDRILNIGLDLADALTRAHRLKIIHRDLKPANVLLTADGVPLLSDFGVAHMGDQPGVTRTGMVVGTLMYLPPEALDGNAPDERGDLWSFGVMLYEMITGVHPFDADTTTGMMTAILFKAAPDVFQYRNDVPWTLMGLVYWMLEKDPQKRPQSARLVGALLENILSGANLPLDWFTSPTDHDSTPIAAIPREEIIRAVRDYTTGGLDVAKLRTPTPPTGSQTNTEKLATPTSSLENTPTAVLPAEALRTPTATAPLPAIPAPHSRQRFGLAGAAGGLLVLIVLGIFAALNSATNGILPTPTTEATISPTDVLIVVPPVGENEYMVLVADFERLGGEERNLKRFILDDLRSHFEEDNPYTRIKIRDYAATIANDAEAIQVAETYAADVMIWGTYDSETATIEVQLGDMQHYIHIPIAHEEIRRLSNARVILNDPRRETLAYSVIAAFNMLGAFNGDVLNMAQNLLVPPTISQSPAVVDGNSVAARYHRFIIYYNQDIEAAIGEMEQAILIDPSNPFLYLAKALGNQRKGDIETARQDLTSLESLGGTEWVGTYAMHFNDALYFTQDYTVAERYGRLFAEELPESWYAHMMLGAVYYLQGDYATAEPILDKSLSLQPTYNVPYAFAVGIALHKGDLIKAQQLIREALTLFPDPTISERLLRVILNEQAAQTPFVQLISAFGNITLRQWRSVLNVTEANTDGAEQFADTYFLRGFASCNLKEYAAANEAYTRGLELEPDYWLLYLLRAEARRKAGDVLGASADVGMILGSPLSAQFAPLIDVSISGELSCENFLTFDFAPFFAEATPETP